MTVKRQGWNLQVMENDGKATRVEFAGNGNDGKATSVEFPGT